MNIRAFAVLALPVVLAACSSEPAASTARPPLEGARIGGPFTLVDQDGRTVTDRDFAGRYRIVYFGYTFCPDVCPVDVQMLGAGLKIFEKEKPALATKVVPIFITVDPARDTPAVLKQFVSAFHPRMVGLSGSESAIDAVAKAYGIYHAKGKTTPAGGYMVDHSRQAYLMDPAGKPLALLPEEGPPQAISDALALWVQ